MSECAALKAEETCPCPRCERPRRLKRDYEEHVRHPSGHWKGQAEAEVPADLADRVAEAMNYYGSIVDTRRDLPDGMVRLFSRGYWAHGF